MNSSRPPADWTPDSPELTAFALKDGPFEQSVPGWAERRSEAEQAVSRSAPLRAEIGEIRRVADDIETRLVHEPVHRLSAERREAVLAYARNPGRGLPRRPSDAGGSASGAGWHRFWSMLTRPALGFSLAAATALSIALALWSPWHRGSGTPGTGVAARPAVSNAPTPPAIARRFAVSKSPVADGSAALAADAVASDTKTPVAGPGDGDDPPAAAAAESLPAAPREEVQRGESHLRWDTVAARPARTQSVAAAPEAMGAKASASPVDSAADSPAPSRSVTAADASRAKAGARVPVVRREARDTREIPFRSVAEAPRSTFPLKPADTSYPQVRQALQEGRLPSPDAVRLEELLNHFSYEYPAPRGPEPLAAHVEVADSPWSPDHRLVKIGLQARAAPAAGRSTADVVVLVGLRPGSASRLAWVQRSLRSLIETMDGRDSLALLLDGPQGRVILPPTSGADRAALAAGLAALRAEGAPRGLDGLRRAYALAAQRRVPGVIQRVVWILDGEFPAEAGTREALSALIREQTEWGVLLKVLALGAEDIPVGKVEANPSLSWMAAPETGAYASATSEDQALSELRRESLSRPAPPAVADEVEVEVVFNPSRVDRWRLLSQETRAPAATASATRGRSSDGRGARIEAGHSVTALYEIVPARDPVPPVASPGAPVAPQDLLSLRVGYRSPAREEASRNLRVGVPDAGRGLDAATADYKFAAAVVGYGLLLRDSPFKGDLTWDKVLALAEEGQGPDREGYRAEFLQLVRKAAALHASEAGSATDPGADAPRAAPVRPGPSDRPTPRPERQSP